MHMLKYLTSLLAGLAVSVLCLFPGPATAASTPYRIQAGDTLQFEVVQDTSLNRQLLVLPDGSVSVPMIGTLPAAGRTVDGLRATIIERLAPNFARKPIVYLSVAAIPQPTQATKQTVTIYMMGEVQKPGALSVLPGTTLIQALASSGGFTNYAAKGRIELLRLDPASHKELVYTYAYQSLISGPSAPVVALQGGDTVVVPQRGLFE